MAAKTDKKTEKYTDKGKYLTYHFSMKGLEDADPDPFKRFRNLEETVKYDVVSRKRAKKTIVFFLITAVCLLIYLFGHKLIQDPVIADGIVALFTPVGGICFAIGLAKLADGSPVKTKEVIKYRDVIEEQMRKNMNKPGRKNR